MRKTMLKKLITLSLTICMCSSIGTTAFASSPTSNSEKTSISSSSKNFSTMTNKELNKYIDDIKNSVENAKSSQSTNDSQNFLIASTSSSIGDAWLAAAQVARNLGYPCAAKLIENSVNNISYKETSGICYQKIITTSPYMNYMSGVMSATSSSGSIAFEKVHNADLFYALHNVNIKTYCSYPGMPFSLYAVTITDTFDFAYDNNYDSLFTSAVNNWAWLCQNAGVLNRIPVTINFNHPN